VALHRRQHGHASGSDVLAKSGQGIGLGSLVGREMRPCHLVSQRQVGVRPGQMGRFGSLSRFVFAAWSCLLFFCFWLLSLSF
jgi:hypothetical protein